MEFLVRHGRNLLRRSVPCNVTGLEHHEAIGNIQKVAEPMLRHDNGPTLGLLFRDDAGQHAYRPHIEV